MMRMIIALLVLLMTGCGSNQLNPSPAVPETSTPAATGILVLFHTSTPGPTATPTDPVTPTPLPSPSPTPRSHTVARGEDMGGIAFRYHVSLEALMAANPNVIPSAMSVGTVLVIPASLATPALPASSVGQPATPTPQGISLGRVVCDPTREGGAVCYLTVTNAQEQAVENVTAVIRMASPDGQTISRPANTLLNRLLPGQSTALSAYFPPPAPLPEQAGAELIAALPSQSGSGRYLEAGLQDLTTTIEPGGLSARVEAGIFLALGQAEADSMWVVAVAYDKDGQVAGLRRWESPAPLRPDERLAVNFTVYSTARPIQRVEALVEARP